MIQNKELKIRCLEIFGASSSCSSGVEVIGCAMNAHDWIMSQGHFSPKESAPDSSKLNGKESHIHMNIGGVADAGAFHNKKDQSKPDQNLGCAASKPEEAREDHEFSVEFHSFISHIFPELLANKPRKSKEAQLHDLISCVPKEVRDSIKKDMQAFVDSL